MEECYSEEGFTRPRNIYLEKDVYNKNRKPLQKEKATFYNRKKYLIGNYLEAWKMLYLYWHWRLEAQEMNKLMFDIAMRIYRQLEKRQARVSF